jgi:hypothetical protein
MRGHFLRGNREVLHPPEGDGPQGRAGNSEEVIRR